MSEYKFQQVSDLNRDGIGVEMVDGFGNPVAEVFRSDAEQTLVISTFGNEISLNDIESLIAYGKDRLAPFENGNSLSEAVPGIVRPSRSKFGFTVGEFD